MKKLEIIFVIFMLIFCLYCFDLVATKKNIMEVTIVKMVEYPRNNGVSYLIIGKGAKSKYYEIELDVQTYMGLNVGEKYNMTVYSGVLSGKTHKIK